MTTHASAQSARLPVAGLWIWTAWVAATALGGMAGLLLTGALGTLLFPVASATFALGYGWVTAPLFITGAGVLLWLPVGVAQGLVLRRVIPGFDRAAILRWVRTTALAGGGATALGALLFGLYFLLAMMIVYDSTPVLVGLCIGISYSVVTLVGMGAVFGLSQRALLGRYVGEPEVWWRATLLGWGLVVPLGLLLVGLILQTLAVMAIIPMMGMMPTLHPSNLLAGALVMTLPAAVTGLALPRLMTLPTREPPGPLRPPRRPRLSLPRRPPNPDLPRLFPE
jgi:hypothetical protein